MLKASKIGGRIEEIILVLLIVLDVLGFFSMLPGDVDYVEKIISWTAVAYIFYRFSFTRIFFGERKKGYDVAIITAYFLLFIKNFLDYATIAINETKYFTDFYRFILDNSFYIETYAFYIGSIMLLLLPVYITLKFKIKKPSLMEVLKQDGNPPREFLKLILRFCIIFFVLIGFFIIVFNMAMEWVAIAVDSPLTVFAILFYVFIIVGRVESFKPESLISKIGLYGHDFFKKFVEAFHSKRGLFLAISGLLVLHLLTEIGVFIIPYLTGFKNPIYFDKIIGQMSHATIYSLLKTDIATVGSFLDKFAVVWIYTLNIVGIILLLLAPAFIWYNYYKNKKFEIYPWLITIFFISVVTMLLAPAFGIKAIDAPGITGVEIWTANVVPTKINMNIIPFISLFIGLIAYFMSLSKFKKRVTAVAIVIVQFFVGAYIFYFFTDELKYYINAIKLLFSSAQYFLLFYFAVFLAIISLFYLGSYLIFLSETQKEFKRED